MTATAAARAAVDPRPSRGTAGRRAVQVVLFLGGLLALGLLAGGRAEAQERSDPGRLTASVAETVTGVGQVEKPRVDHAVKPVAEPAVEPVAASVVELDDRAVRHQAAQHGSAQHGSAQHGSARHGSAQHGSAEHRAVQHRIVQPEPEPEPEPEPARNATVASSAARSAAPATKPVTEPVDTVAAADPVASAPAPAPAPALVRDARDAVVGGAGDAVERITGEARPLVAAVPGLPPLLSVLPELPAPGGAPDAPGAPGAPSPSAPDTGRGAGGPSTPGDPGAGASAERAAGGHGRSTGAAGLVPVVADRSGTPHAGHAQLTAPTPTLPPTRDRAPFAPCGDFARTAVADAQGPRGGDLHATPVPGSPYAALAGGAGLPATAAPITDRSGEIFEFPG
ncbi:hypothetical protein [Streptomyces sp. SH5]|uniref:hypothetical protein n=1 Tax=Streptomyces sp. SH5 TaxID=3041765 RepID=UPI0024780990|nr:hypothetical protein [Streptomyces sp. SH5]WGP12203.1 hypothetical protein QFA72_22290 [Streptomyces sp. SH5]